MPEHVASAGPDVAELAELAGVALDAEQRLVLDTLLAEDADGRWAAFEGAHIEARQNGKTVVLQAIALADMFLFDTRLVVWTAHLFRTTQEAFRDIDRIIAGQPDFSRRVKRVSRANGEEGFELFGDQRLDFRARSKTAGRGLTGDRVILDEAFAIGAGELGSLIPTMSARPNPQLLYASSAGLLGSGVLREVRDRGRKGGDPSLAYIEWCAPEGGCVDERCTHAKDAVGCVLDDPERWRMANHTLDRRITRGHVGRERRAMPPEEFARERLGWWDDPASGLSGIPSEAWAECARRDAGVGEPVALAVDVTPGHTMAAIVACGGALHVADHRRGTHWIVERLVELCGQHQVLAVGLDPSAPVGAVIPELEKAGLGEKLVLVDARQMAQGCEAFLSGVLDRSLRHRDQLALNTAVDGAGRRQLADSWKWSRRDSSTDISPLVAATVARWLYMQYRPPEPPVRIASLGDFG